MAELLFYQRPEALNRETHSKLRYTPPKDYSFAKKAMAVPLMAAEFPLACRQFPIVFTQDGAGGHTAVAVLSLADKGNPFIDDKGNWTGKYIPAFVRRYPFVLANVPDKKDDFAVAFDADSGCFDKEQGEPIFNDKGEPTKVLENQVQFLRRFHAENTRTQDIIKTLRDEELLKPINVDITRAGDQQKFGMRNALVVDEPKLQKLDAEKAAKFLSSGILAIAFAHLISLQNFDVVANRTAGGGGDIPWWAK